MQSNHHPNLHPIQKTPRVVCIGGTDSSGGAGLAADEKAVKGFGVDFVGVPTAHTQQTHKTVQQIKPVALEIFEKELVEALSVFEDEEILVIKTGMLVSDDYLSIILNHVPQNAFLICDPVLKSSSGVSLFEGDLNPLLERATLTTPNAHEPQIGQQVYLKGGHADAYDGRVWDEVTLANETFYISAPKLSHGARGTGCFLASAMAACLALGMELPDALVAARAGLQKALRTAKADGEYHILNAHFWPPEPQDMPTITQQKRVKNPFPGMGQPLPDFYPIVDNVELLKTLLEAGVKTIQLRIKDAPGDLEKSVQQAVALQNKYNARLFINDHWKLAIKHKAYGVHLGQEDIETADLQAIHAAGLRLGVSTHCYAEAARAHGAAPSYIALGPIFPTNSKEMRFSAQGLETLALWRQLFKYPLVAIGGITLEKSEQVKAQKPDLISVIGDVCYHINPTERAKQWLVSLKA